ncbi:UPL2, partial [Symbiodinium sp. KB8]
RDRMCRRFWRIMEGLSNEDLSNFVRFVWGRSRLPKPSEWGTDKPFKLTKRGGGDDQLPLAHTCFNQLELPDYSSEEVMKQRLLTAINFGMDAFLMA